VTEGRGRLSRRQFERLVAEAMDRLPSEHAELLDNVAVVVEEEPSPEVLEELGIDAEEEELFGLYDGVPLTEREVGSVTLPDRVVLYRGPILRSCRSRREVLREIRDTLVHEIGHHFGLSDEEMPY
jgi:predicted Zn-dependent protease with MMP-like domain